MLVTPCRGPCLDISGRKTTVDIATFSSEQNRRYGGEAPRRSVFLYLQRLVRDWADERSIDRQHPSLYPQQGFVDHVVYPPRDWVGWFDHRRRARSIRSIRYVERHTSNNWTRLLVRGGLNPARSLANVLEFRPPWYRDNRPRRRLPLSFKDLEFMESLRERNTVLVRFRLPRSLPLLNSISLRPQSRLTWRPHTQNLRGWRRHCSTARASQMAVCR